MRILDRDLKLAGIPKKDERGRPVDVHALRHSFGTLLSKAGVAPRTAQAAMRHSSIDLTMNVYTDPKLPDVSGAMGSLPSLPLSGGSQKERNVAKATGTGDYRSSPLALGFAPSPDFPSKSWSSADKTAADEKATKAAPRNVVSADGDKRKHPLTSGVKGCLKVGATPY